MIKLEFTEAEKQNLHYERYHHPHPRVQRKMEALWLKSQGRKKINRNNCGTAFAKRLLRL